MKKQLYVAFIERMEGAVAKGYYLEASWYASALIEDRLLSLLRSTGTEFDSRGKPMRMLGAKVAELARRSKANELLRVSFDAEPVRRWTRMRNDLVHAMANGTRSLSQVEAEAEALGKQGSNLVRVLAATARRMKKRLAVN
jgi:hypothetical protein